MAPGVFVYGSLMSFRVLESLIHNVPKILPAYIPGMTRLAIKTEVFPGIMKTSDLSNDNFPSQYHEELQKYLDPTTPSNDFVKIKKTNHHINKVQGLVLKNLTDQQIQILDYFELDDYEKLKLPIVVGYDKNWNVEEAFVYVYKYNYNLYDFWDFDKFCKDELSSYLEMCADTRVSFFQTQLNKKQWKRIKTMLFFSYY